MTQERKPDSGTSLAELEARFRRDLELLTLPPAKDWLEPRMHPEHGPVLDVAIIGAGMAGLAAAFALKCLAVRSLRVFDRAPAGFEGPWATDARMETLRSPPELSGPAFGFANLTFRAWFEAQFGLAAWSKLHRIPRLQWMDYLRWYRRMIDVPIENETELIDIGGDGEFVVLTLRSAAGTRKVAARRVVLANGRDGLGGPYTPEMFRGLDPRYVRTRSTTSISPALRGKMVGVHRRRLVRGRQRGGSARSTAPRASPCWCGAPTCRASTRAWASAAPASGAASTRSPMRRNGRS